MTFPELQNAHANQPAVVIGKGPTLDAWIAAGCPQPAGAVRIGVNQVACRVSDVAYSVSGDVMMDAYLRLPTRWLRGLPYLTEQDVLIERYPPCWEYHGVIEFDARSDVSAAQGRLDQSRGRLAETHQLYCHLGSANPAVHLAWYLGCSELLLVGIDGGTARAPSLTNLPDRPTPPTYDLMKRSVQEQCDTLFGSRWRHWSTPARQRADMPTTGEKWKYDGIYGPHGLPGYGHSNHGQNALKWLAQRHQSLLDVGCGHNEFVRAWRKLEPHYRASGVDFACPSADFIAPATALPFKDGQFTLVTAFDVLEHLPENEVMPALREMARVSRWYCFSIATSPSRILWQGENLHPTVRPLDWWLDRIRDAGGESHPGPPGYVYGRWKPF